MHLQSLYLRNFRSYEDELVTFSPHCNLILGKNGEGKTNLLEAISLLCTGKSFRTFHLTDLICLEKETFYLEACFFKEGVEQSLQLTFDGKIKSVVHNATVYQGFLPLIGLLPIVVCAPEDGALISGPPAERRRFLDLQIAQSDPLYLYHLSRYYRAMKQRNVLLKKRLLSTISSWEEIMALSGTYLIQKRQSAIDRLNQSVGEFMQELSGEKEKLELHYLASVFTKREEELIAALRAAFEKYRSKEMEIGSTLHGPHRDEIQIFIDERSAKSFSSEGQKRCALLALRLAEWQRMHEETLQKPFLALDDFTSHLDKRRLRFLEEKLCELGQIFLTSPESDLTFLNQKANFLSFTVSKGKVYGI